nr:hypothetical protein [Tanacetum cinerariifolium]
MQSLLNNTGSTIEYSKCLVADRVMDAPTLPVSAKKNPGDPIDIKLDIVYPTPADVFPAATVIRTLAQHGEAIRGIHGHLEGVPISEEMNSLRFRMGMVEEENASLHGGIKTMEAIDTITRRHEKRARMELKRQLTSVQESQRQDQENFRKLQEIMPTTRQGANVSMTLEAVQAMIDQTLLRNNTTDDGSQNSGLKALSAYLNGLKRWNQFSILVVVLLRTRRNQETKIELWDLKVKGNDVGGYTQCFQELALMCTKFISNETEKKLRTYVEGQAENKRKLDNNHQAQQQRLKKQNVA